MMYLVMMMMHHKKANHPFRKNQAIRILIKKKSQLQKLKNLGFSL